MVFSNLVFIFAFLPIVISLYYLIRKEFRNSVLLIASLFFYAWGEPTYLFLMIFSISTNYLLARVIIKTNKYRRIALIIAIIINIILLGYYKYAGFILSAISGVFNFTYDFTPVALPIGISFYTFQAIAYLVDIYRNEIKPQKNILDFALYISFFPQLVAGPIVRYDIVAAQLKDRKESVNLFAQGCIRFIIGLGKKVLIANQLGLVADEIFSSPHNELTTSLAWIGILAYTLQIYFDFSGYSDMAIGLGKMFGFKLPINFNYPYISKSITEFWRRWHITLGSWFRDYIYIPLGGNRQGKWKYARNLFVVWFLTGLWHGASWSFVIWGLYFGVIIALEKMALSKVLIKLWAPLQHLYVLLIVMIGWVFFRADNFVYSFHYLKIMFGINTPEYFDHTTVYYLHDYGVYFILGIIFSIPIKKMLSDNRIIFSQKFQVIIPVVYIILFLLSIMYLTNSTYNPFIYFRF
ncbi:MBOAT family protein [Paenibacillus sp. JCM 10914]|uniref:MBOAT family O-acyltransferase n=1 Tax=Paenibacillus sp. JCM 10914 TaxID=1236974 RepID=UPI0003CCAD06|nr:MBOAT family O-acyltransferase [Paenibacillus sp. JCM 10914]GAE09680.1 transcriptional regulator [Paenibacillus sp. JCM 10914]